MKQCIFGLFAAFGLMSLQSSVMAEENCNTALTRIARKEAEKAIAQHQGDACSGLKKGPIGYDDTKELELRGFKLCENGPVVSASITVHVKCATGGGAFIHDSIEDNLTANASANLDTCQMMDANVSGGSTLVQLGLSLGNVSNKLREAGRKEIAPYCK